HPKAHQKLEVAIFGDHTGYKHAQPQTYQAHKQNKYREKDHTAIYVYGSAIHIIINIKGYKNEQLDAKLHQIGDDDGQRHNDPWKIHLPKNSGIGFKGITGSC